MKQILEGVENEKPLLAILQQFVNNRHLNHDQDIATIRKSANAPFSFCGKLVNDLKEILNVSYWWLHCLVVEDLTYKSRGPGSISVRVTFPCHGVAL
jgi:hypothetical protein